MTKVITTTYTKQRFEYEMDTLKERSVTESEAEAWALELDALAASKMSGAYNRWHTLDDYLDYGALLRGIHKIQERGGSVTDEKRFCNSVCDRFGHERMFGGTDFKALGKTFDKN